MSLKTNPNTFLEDAIKELRWQGGTQKQVLNFIYAARNVAAENKRAELTGDYSRLSEYLNKLEAVLYE